MADPTANIPTTSVDPTIPKGTASPVVLTPDPREVRWNEIRSILLSRLVSCPDCQKLARTFVDLMDVINPPDPNAALPAAPVAPQVSSHANATVTVVPPTPSVAAAGQGREVAPGVVIIDPK